MLFVAWMCRIYHKHFTKPFIKKKSIYRIKKRTKESGWCNKGKRWKGNKKSANFKNGTSCTKENLILKEIDKKKTVGNLTPSIEIKNERSN